MVNRGEFIQCILVLCLLLTITLGTVTQINLNPRISDPVREFAALTPHAPIMILDNDGFGDLGFPGYGNESHPYRIENYSISSDNAAIVISGTTAHFLIRNCSITSTSDSAYAISLYNSDNGTIENCTVTADKNGIIFEVSHNITIRNNTVTQATSYGIRALESDDCVIEMNRIRDVHRGVSLYRLTGAEVAFNHFSNTSSYCVSGSSISDCSIFNNTLLPRQAYGLKIGYSCSDIVIANNSVEYPSTHGLYYAFRMTSSQNISLIRNNFVKNGISISGDEIEEWNTHTIEYNTIDDAPIAYFKDDSYKEIDASLYGEVILANISHSNVSNGVFDDCYVGIVAGFCDNLRIEDCSASPVKSALLKMYYCYNSVVSNCYVESSENNGMGIYDCINCTVVSSTITDCSTGVFLSWSTSTNVTDSIITNSTVSIEGFTNEDCSINGNVFQSDTIGIEAHSWLNCHVQNNTFTQLKTGVYLASSNFTQLIGNIFSKNDDYGVRILSSSYNSSVHDNMFYRNSENAVDDGSFSEWDDGISKGNAWDDYSGSGLYYIPGSAGSVDHYPCLLPDTTPPTIIDHPDLILNTSISSYTITWYPTDENPSDYRIFSEFCSDESYEWNGSAIDLTFPVIENRYSNITLIVYDIYGNYAADTVMVIVMAVSSTTLPSTTTTDDTSDDPTTSDTNNNGFPVFQEPLFIVVALGIIGLSVLLVIIMKMRKV